MAETATRVLSFHHPSPTSSPVKLISPHGNDDFGLLLRTGMQQAGMRTDGLFTPADDGERTAVCSLMLDDSGDLISGVADMDIGQAALYSTCSHINLAALLEEEAPEMIVFDGNIGAQQAGELLTACETYNSTERKRILTLFEPTSVTKSTIILSHFAESTKSNASRQPITFATPNAVELEQIHATCVDLDLLLHSTKTPQDSVSNIPSNIVEPSTLVKAKALVDAKIFSTVLLKVGRHGVVTIDATSVQHHPIPAGQVEVVNTTGCGDSFAGAFTATLSHLLSQNNASPVEKHGTQWYEIINTAVEIGQLAARNTLASTRAVGEGMHLLLKNRA
ncbi:uncharacterized protein UTRI_00070_B [Ustilago trichophora]|uniref:Carbohydrate kinase PfkB domain-containing protein n=1 Tax=Ustilago trichophora TaxID=86804 RepID=A0A5C3DNZ9_9BASI|nr:uncharacterized protein UTRI_00070_B [Ustilago trichophora]